MIIGVICSPFQTAGDGHSDLLLANMLRGSRFCRPQKDRVTV